MRTIPHWIAGKEILSAADRTSPVFDPATGRQTAEVLLASPGDVDEAVWAAVESAPGWRAASLSTRADVLFRFRQLLIDHQEELVDAISAEHGKVRADAAGELARGIENVEFACGIPALMKGGFTEQASTGVDVYSVRQPVGVVAGITPFNFPVMVPLWMLATALACGNSFVLKPSEKDPSGSLLLARLLGEAGLPEGVFNVVQGDRVAVDRLLGHPDVGAVSFVGSTPVARYVYQQGTAAGKRVQALGGAKNHMVVLPDADVEIAADAAVSAAYGSAGERCMAVSVVVAVGAVADPLVAAVAARLETLRIGPATDPGAEMGPLISAEHRDRVAEIVGGATAEGARVVVDGNEASFEGDGFFTGVTLLDHVRPGMRTYDEEIFGPVLSVVRVERYEEAVQLVNDNPYGNGCALFTRDGAAARRFQFDVLCGMVGINVPIPVPVAYYSFGGWKQSLFGDTHMYGQDGIDFCTRTKVVTSRWPNPSMSEVDLRFPVAR